MATPVHLISGLDLGKSQDYSALAVVERSKLDQPVAKRRYRYALRWLQTWELGTRYTSDDPAKPSIISGVKELFDTPQLRWTPLAIDQTGVGNAVIDIVRAAKVPARITPVVITAGHQTTIDPKTREAHVPKKELVSTLLVLMEGGLLKYPASAPGAFGRHLKKLQKELAEFRVTVTRARNETFGADASQHDDLVLALAMAVWLGERWGGGDPSGIGSADPAEGTAVGSAPTGVFVTGNGV